MRRAAFVLTTLLALRAAPARAGARTDQPDQPIAARAAAPHIKVAIFLGWSAL